MGNKIALDIGISSVGWAVVGDDLKIIDAGSRLFDSADTSKNEDRRSNRGRRRLLRRKANRINELKKMWEVLGLEWSEGFEGNPLILRNKALNEKLTEKELHSVLRNILKHRGISYLEDAIDEDKGNDYQKALAINAKELSERLPCEIQLERYNEFNKYRGDNIVNKSNDVICISNVFTNKGYMKEIERILDCQSKYHEFIDDNFIAKYTEIFSSKRLYYEGPGNEKSRTDYGKYTTKINAETGEFITEDNIFEKLIGRCSVYEDQMRASGSSYTAQEFNILNDLNNLNINGEKLTEKEKRKIVQVILSEKSTNVNMKKIIKSVINVEISSFTGARIDKQDNEIFHTFEAYRKLKKILDENGMDISIFCREELDIIAHILTINTDKESIIEAINRENLKVSQEMIEIFVEFRKKNSKLFNKWHSFSVKLMNELMEDLYRTSKNQMELLADMGVFKSINEKFKEYSEIPYKLVTEEIYNPIVVKAVNQSIKVLNKLILIYGYPDDVIIEMARDKNEDDQKNRIKKFQADNEKELLNIIKKIHDESKIKIHEEIFYRQKTLKTKLRLWNEQKGKCPYSGKTIYINDMLNSPELFEIDHIIPISISFDDSRNNKVLVYRSENQLKGNRTPFMYLKSLNREWNYDKYKILVKDMKCNYKKTSNLLFEESITKQEVVKGFINRNLNDTRYASRVVLNTLQNYFKAHEINTKVKVINGSFTAQLRNKLKLEKNRDESYSHHAIDAITVCYSQLGLNTFMKNLHSIIDYETGEILNIKEYSTMSDEDLYKHLVFYERIKEMNKNIDQIKEKIKYSYKVDKKVNRQLSNETIYGTRMKKDGTIQKISKIKDIYSKDGFEKFKKKMSDKNGKNKLEDFLMYHNDPKSFDLLMKTATLYRDETNPFLAYKEDVGEPIRKYSKNGKGPFITSLKYYDGEVRSHIDISHKYGHEKGAKKVVLDSLKPYRTDVYYKKEDNSYHLAGIKYINFKFTNGEYLLDEDSYNKILVDEKILDEGISYRDIENYGFEFMFSLYKNDIILYEKNGDTYIERFLSRTMPNQKNYIETKPINKNKFDKQNLVGLGKTSKIVKINTDILGNRHYTTKEKFNLGINLDK
ncbi:MAG: type II CRISPR RNA-guided endonuclease Cas9 [Tissierellales bacterium]|nr:type II CRISPR RNA-guided endonuclease Cas9 [Tissierellales bacterium]MBN2828045.1 type II CRISPR RNA-guided endonuclease Cas9 [Tissierellales bacterium]